MPIDIETFDERSSDDLQSVTNAEKVIRFLAANDDKAYTPSEIADRVDVKRNSLGTVLSRLEDRDLVRHKGDYWAIGDMETVRNAYEMHRIMESLNERYGEEDIEEWRAHAAEGDSR
ncbi:MarR family transcriptional regulator [Haloterrigena alkaliphila]|uniref:MarR family transcriptional regulator n=1 Tax=Haloterrigena alkaliphila TaxID=2816475 RepID=A0A8A2VAK7_9EURY|nr:helix-turn-helix domain-containing protein [Haloterrigena alkaliphila]QSW97750.1 MarR family transcriptional regulator [Haloterrigena alkaliphila]